MPYYNQIHHPHLIHNLLINVSIQLNSYIKNSNPFNFTSFTLLSISFPILISLKSLRYLSFNPFNHFYLNHLILNHLILLQIPLNHQGHLCLYGLMLAVFYVYFELEQVFTFKPR